MLRTTWHSFYQGDQSDRCVKRRRPWRSFEKLEDRWLLAGDVVMFNDHIGGPATHPFVTTYSPVETPSGLLRDSETGTLTSTWLETHSSGASFENSVGDPAPGTDAHALFADWIDFSSQAGSSIAVSGSDTYTLTFSGLAADRTYDVAGTAVRGRSSYTDRWTLVTLVGAESFAAAHSTGVGIVTAGLAANQVALWTGANHQPGQGFVVEWTEIDAGADGSFTMTSQQYQGPTPGVGSGDSTGGSKGYGLAAVRLIEHDQSFHVTSSDPPPGAALTQPPTSYTVNFNSPIDVATVQASDLTVDGNVATAVQVVDADSLEFTLPLVSDEGFHTVEIAEGAISSADTGLPLVRYSVSFAILSGSGIVINEVHYDSGDDSKPWEFLELFNTGDAAVDMSGWGLEDAVTFTMPGGTVLGSGQYLVVSQHPAEFASHFGKVSLGPFNGRLSNDGETVTLRDNLGVKQDEVDYQLGFPWPTIGDILGQSIQLVLPALKNDLGGNWRSASATPGAANAVFAFNSAPQMRQVNHSPETPVSGQDVKITMKVTDPEGVQSVSLEYQLVNPGDYIEIIDSRYATDWTAVAMGDDGIDGDATAGDSIYTAVLAGNLQTHRRLVRYRVTAVDAWGAQITAPYADDPQPNFAYFVYEQTPDWTGAVRPGVTPEVTYDSELLDSVATYHLITTRTDHVDSQFIPDSTRGGGYSGSDYLWHGALVYDGQVYDHIRFRARGGVWRYSMGKNMWKFDFNRGHGFEARDDYGNKYQVDWSKLNLSAIIQQGDFWHRGEQGLFEAVGLKLFNLAGVESSNTNFVHFRIVESADETGSDQYRSDFQGLYLAIEQLDDQFLEQHDLPDGNLYKMEGGTGVGGIGGESNNQGDYPAVSDSSDLIEFKTTYESGPQSADWWRDNLDLESYYSYRSIVEGIHHYDIGNGKNYFYYLHPDTDKWITVPWDLDLTWANNMYGNGNEPFRDRVLAISEYSVAYRNRMREIRDLLYNSDQAGMLVDEIASFVYAQGEASLVDADRAMWDYNPILTSDYVRSSKAGHGRFYAGGGGIPATGSFEGMVQLVKDYVASKGSWIDVHVLAGDALIPLTPTISYTGSTNFPINGLQFTTSDFAGRNGSFAAMEWRIGEISNPATPLFDPHAEWTYEIDAVWESGELSSHNRVIDVPGSGLTVGHTYRARVRMQDDIGHWSRWSDPVEFVAAPATELGTSIVISEINYHPYDPTLGELAVDGGLRADDFEFLEITNTHASESVELLEMELTDGVTFTFGNETLGPGESAVVVEDVAAFQTRYGDSVRVLGQWSGGLSAAGERLTLVDAGDRVLFDVQFGDADPWPVRADGSGASLELIRDDLDQDTPVRKHYRWRGSTDWGGSPGEPGTDPRGVVVNEILSNSDMQPDTIEL